MSTYELIVIACPLIDLLEVKLIDLFLAFSQSMALPNELIFPSLHIEPGCSKSLS